jgi:hypothetical protein
LDAARRELDGETVATKASGEPWDHVSEVEQAQRRLLKIMNRISSNLCNADLSVAQKRLLVYQYGQASRLLDYSERFVPRPG